MYNTLYLGLDAHTRNCVLATMNSPGRVVSTREFSTSETALIRYVTELPARSKHLMLEESSLAGWIASALRPYVTQLIVCDPRHNALISHGNKSDRSDAVDLCRLLRLGEFVEVFHSDQACRTDFKIAVQQYLRVRNDHAKLKCQIKAKYHQAGVVNVRGTEVFTKTHRGSYLDRLPTQARQKIIAYLYDRLDTTGELRKKARATMIELGKPYPEIQRFQRVPGIGVVGAHVFSAFIQTPHRFATKQRLWKYCKLGIRERSSAGKPLAYKRLDRSGSGALKDLSYRCWLTSQQVAVPNEVSLFYEASLLRTDNPIHARLNTQRKILTVLWTIWKKDVDYNPTLFYSPPKSTAVAQTVETPLCLATDACGSG